MLFQLFNIINGIFLRRDSDKVDKFINEGKFNSEAKAFFKNQYIQQHLDVYSDTIAGNVFN